MNQLKLRKHYINKCIIQCSKSHINCHTGNWSKKKLAIERGPCSKEFGH